MNENVNLSKILRDCLKGTKLYSPLFGVVKFEEISEDWNFVCVRKGKDIWTFTYDARFLFGISNSKSAEIMLFPSKDQRDWSKFNVSDKIEPKFNVGDWVVFLTSESVYQVEKKENYEYTLKHIFGGSLCVSFSDENLIREWTIQDAKDGDVLVNGSNIFIFHFINNRRLMGYCHVNMDDGNFYNDIGKNECFCTIDAPVTPATKEQRDALMKAMNDAGYKWNPETKTLEKLIETKFKVGDKFDPNILQPFDKVLVRDDRTEKWQCSLFSYININDDIYYPYVAINTGYKCCIPYNDDTEHLVGTTKEAPEYYRYWED